MKVINENYFFFYNEKSLYYLHVAVYYSSAPLRSEEKSKSTPTLYEYTTLLKQLYCFTEHTKRNTHAHISHVGFMFTLFNARFTDTFKYKY